MPQHHHQTFDQNGKLISEVIEEYEEPGSSPKEQAKEKLRNANSIAALKAAIVEYIDAPEEGL